MKAKRNKIITRTLPAGSRILAVSDLHMVDEDFDAYFSSETCEHALQALVALVCAEKPTELWVLGDMFHMSLRNPLYALEQLRILDSIECSRVTILAGNHDAEILDIVVQQYPLQRCEISFATFVVVRPAGGDGAWTHFTDLRGTPGDCIWLTHDGDDSVWLSEAECVPYLHHLREYWKITDAALLLTGHTHRLIIADQGRTCSLGVWNVPGHSGIHRTTHYTYADIQISDVEICLTFQAFTHTPPSNR